MLRRRQFLISYGLLAASSLTAKVPIPPVKPVVEGVFNLKPPTAQVLITPDGFIRKEAFMDTGTGNPVSGMFGNVRKDVRGRPRFHEGIDIAPVQPWHRRRLPKDQVKAAADGVVVYLNRTASLYGNYVVMVHDVPGIGPIYTLYAHLIRYAKGLRAGQRITQGTILGTMGNVPRIPVSRSHVHFEIGFMMNRAYPIIDDDHGIWNGANLYGFDPMAAFLACDLDGTCYLKSYLQRRKAAFVLILEMAELPDYCKRYKYVWQGPAFRAGLIQVAFTQEGIPLTMGNAYLQMDPERDHLPFVKEANMALVKQGRPYVERYVGHYRLTDRGTLLVQNLLITTDATEVYPGISEII